MKKSIIVKSVLLSLSFILLTFSIIDMFKAKTATENIQLSIDNKKDNVAQFNATLSQEKKYTDELSLVKSKVSSIEDEKKTLISNTDLVVQECRTLEEEKKVLTSKRDKLQNSIDGVDTMDSIPYIYYDNIFDEELINVIVQHFEGIRTHNVTMFEDTLYRNTEYLLRRLEYSPQYIKKIAYMDDPFDKTRTLPTTGFFTSVITTCEEPYQGDYAIGVNNNSGRWLIHDYD